MKKYFYELMTDAREGILDEIVQVFLWFFSFVYGFIVFITRGLYRIGILSSYKSPKPVISVGNITVGGVGKTPIVIWLVKALQQRGLKVVILSRGYGAKDGDNDEIKMLRELLPGVSIAVGRVRAQSIRKVLAEKEVDLFIADDAFQHWPLKRDLDIVAIDAAKPFGNGHLLPRGVLREDFSELARAGVLILTKSDQAGNFAALFLMLQEMNPKALILVSKHTPKALRNIFNGETYSLDTFKGQKAGMLCAIGDPSFFELMLKQLGFNLEHNFVFEDHHHYGQEELKKLAEQMRSENISILVTTHKDAVKMMPFSTLFQGINVLSLDIELEITERQDELVERIISLQHS